ncbi:Inner membrane protein YdcO [Rhodobacteraceae bacterium THAF1]|nr:Inner membrane protein YdcO [Palleronia sp. THAF1]VDC17255.1 Inner membrane protein YdcO [Rhodobacteraceae bacterium THAF1]
MLKDLTFPAIYMGLLAAFVGFSSSFAIVLAGLSAMGATEGQVATGLFFATLGMGIGSIWLAAATRIPAAVAWSTPGAAFLASTQALPGGFPEAVGALIVCAGLIVLTGLIPALGRAVAAIPKPIANALLAGVLLPLCLAPAQAAGLAPWAILPLVGAWIVGLALHRLAAMPATILALIAVIAFGSDNGAAVQMGGLPDLTPIAPVFSLQAVISIGIPLYLVTMAGQNIPGFAVLDLHGYTYDRPPLLRRTGIVSAAFAPFGSIPVNMSAITAAMMSGEDAGPDPARRYWAAITSGVAYVVLAVFAAPVVALAAVAPAGVITAVAGLALIPALVGALSGAFGEGKRIEGPALTLLISASGTTLLGISGAVWGVLAGLLVWGVTARRR